MKALLIGATGLIGSHCLDILLKDEYYDEVEAWVRNSSGISHPKLKEKIIKFDEINEVLKVEADHFYCCLGTTMKKAKTQEAFRKVDLEYPTGFAKLAERSSARKFFVISSIGANKNTSNFYLRTKGEMEENIKGSVIPGIFYVLHFYLVNGKKPGQAR